MKKFFLFGILFLFLFISLVSASHPTIVGYDEYNNTLEVWNNDTTYYFNASSGIQWTEQADVYWTKNIFCLGYFNGEDWNKIKCADEISGFNRQDRTDNTTYVNVTYWKDTTFGGYDFRMAIRYHLLTNDEKLSVILSVENRDTENYTGTIGFAWKVKEIDISGEDYVFINRTAYYLNDTIDENFQNITYVSGNNTYYHPHYEIRDGQEGFIKLDWSENLKYRVNLFSNGSQPTSKVTLYIKAGSLNAGQTKTTSIYWQDPDTGKISPNSTSDGASACVDMDNVLVEDTNYGYCDKGKDHYVLYNSFGLVGAGCDNVSGILIECVDCYVESEDLQDFEVRASCDAGVGWSNWMEFTPDLQVDTDTLVSYGGVTDMWGLTCACSDFDTNDRFRINVRQNDNGVEKKAQMDWLPATIYYNLSAADDTSFTVTLPTGTTMGIFNAINKSSKDIQPENQTSSVPFFNISNDGNVNLNISLYLNQTHTAEILLKADDDNTAAGATTVTATPVVIKVDLGQEFFETYAQIQL